jgi:RNA polymerase sigma factor (sigma-70 family)
MTAVPLAKVVQHLHELAATAHEAEPSDAQLLHCFTQTRDAAAFETLIRRHGPMVHGVCQRILGPGPDLEDAFQATFLVLARKAGTIRKRAALGSWLYGVARRAAANMRCQRARRHARQTGLNAVEGRMESTSQRVDPVTRASLRELGAIVDEEIERLPDRHREALLLCHFEGLSTEAAAQRLGCPSGTLKGWLVRARSLLRQRLQRRGVTLSVTALAVLCSEHACRAALPSKLVSAAVQAGLAFAVAPSAGAGGPGTVRAAALAEQVMSGGAALRAKLVLAVLACCLAVGGVGLAGYGFVDQPPAPMSTAATKDDAPAPGTKAVSERVDQYGDPLPVGALARLGTKRFRTGGMLALAPDGQTAVTGGYQKTYFWDVATGKLIRSVDGGGRVVGYSPDGRLVASVDVVFDENDAKVQFGKVYVWDAATGKRLAQLQLPINGCPSLAFSPDSTILAVGGRQFDNQGRCHTLLGLWRWDGTGLKPLWEAKSDQSPTASDLRSTAVAFSADGKHLASGGFLNNTIRIWNVQDGKEIRQWKASGTQVRALAFAPTGNALASGSADGSVALWDPASATKRWEIKQAADVAALAFAPDGKTLAVGGGLFRLPPQNPSLNKPFLVLLDAANGKEVRRLAVEQARQHVNSVAFSKDGKVLAASGGGRLRFWDVITGKQRPGPAGHDDSILAVAIAEDGQTAATAGVDGLVILWDPGRGTEKLRLQGHGDAVVGARFVPGGKLLASASADQDPTVRLWDLATGKEVQLLKANSESLLYAFAVSPDGKLLAAGDLIDGGVYVWDLATAKLLHTLRNGEPHKPGVDREKMAAGVNCLAFSPDSKILATGEHSGREGACSIVLWNAVTGTKLRAFPADTEGVNSLAFAPDGNMLASSGMASNRLSFWDVDSGNALFDLPCAPFGVVAFSPDGKTIAWGSQKESICLWEISSRKVRHKFSGHTGHPQTLAFSPDGRTLVSAGGATALVWDVTGLRHDGKTPPTLTPERMHALWKALASPDASEAAQAIWTLAADPTKAVPFVVERLRDQPGADPQRIRQWIAELDSKEFKARQTAEKQLEALGKLAEPALRETLARQVSLEFSQRIRKLLQKREAAIPSPAMLQALRAMEALEHVGSMEARQALQQIAKETADDYYRQEAHAAALRLEKRAGSPN